MMLEIENEPDWPDFRVSPGFSRLDPFDTSKRLTAREKYMPLFLCTLTAFKRQWAPLWRGAEKVLVDLYLVYKMLLGLPITLI